MQSMQVLPLYAPLDALVIRWSVQDNTNEEIRNFLGALVSVTCDFADIIVLTEPSEVQNISEGLASLEIPEEYVQYVTLLELPASFDWLFSQDTERNIHLIQTRETKAQTSFIDLLKSQDDFFSATISNLPLYGLRQESLQVVDNDVAFIAQADLDLTQKSAQELAHLLGFKTLISLNLPSPFLRLSQLLRATPQGLLLAQAPESNLSLPLDAFIQEVRSLIGQHQLDVSVDHFPLPNISEQTFQTQATYGDFLVINEAVLVPQFDCSQDEAALEAILNAFPGREVYGIPAIASNDEIIELHSRVFCLPEGTLFPAS